MDTTNLLLGGEGLLGKALTSELEASGEKTLSFDLKSGFDLRTQPLPSFSSNCYVWFLAWDVGGAKYIMNEERQLNILRNNFQLCSSVFEWLHNAELHFTFVSTQMIDYKNAYGITKRMAEFWASLIGRGSVARLWNIYDAEEPSERSHVIPDLVAQGKSGRIRLLTEGHERRQFLHARDCARALVHQRRTGQSFADITTGEWVSIRQVATIIGSHFASPVEVALTSGYESLVEPTEPLEGWLPQLGLREGLRLVINEMQQRGWA